MQYKINPKNGDKLSILALGAMRLPKDEAERMDLIRRAVDSGVNYIDTAYLYPGSEAALGRALTEGYRDRVVLADKLPPYLVKKNADIEKIFSKQLERLQTDRIEYYMIHMLPTAAEWQRLCDLGLLDWVAEQKKAGRIKNFGFSYHGGVPAFEQLIDAWDWDFCMIQYNYYDENKQAGKRGLRYATEQGIPVMVMEPLRGGWLANRLPKEAQAVWEAASQKRSPAEWALRWVWNQPQPLTVLSGMSSMEVLEENLRIAAEVQPGALTEEDMARYESVRNIIAEKTQVACTGCNYCMPCPAGVDIPMCFTSLNDQALLGKMSAQMNYIIRAYNHNASLCTQCGACEKHCPQQLAVREELKKVKKALEGPTYKPFRFGIKTFMRLK